MRNITDGAFLAGAAALAALAGGLLLLPVRLAFAWALNQRRAEIRKEELKDAEGF